MLFYIAVCNVSRIHYIILVFTKALRHNKISNVASKVLKTKQKEFTFVLAYPCSFTLYSMIRFGGFLCFMFISLPGFTEHALYFGVRQGPIVKCKFLYENISTLYIFMFLNITIAINFNSYFALDVKKFLFTFLTISG